MELMFYKGETASLSFISIRALTKLGCWSITYLFRRANTKKQHLKVKAFG